MGLNTKNNVPAIWEFNSVLDAQLIEGLNTNKNPPNKDLLNTVNPTNRD